MNRRTARPRRGATLAEMTVSLLIATLLFGAIGSAIFVTGAALPTKNSSYQRAADAALALDRLASGLRYATHLPALTSDRAVFLVPDRDHDGDPERIGFRLTGAPNGALEYSNNRLTWDPLIANVHALQLERITIPKALTAPGIATETVDRYSFYGSTDLSNVASLTLSSNVRIAQAFRPALAAGVSQFRVREVRVRLGAAIIGWAAVTLYEADDAGRPTGDALASENVSSASMAWTTANFPADGPILDVAKSYCVVLSRAGSLDVRTQVNPATGPGYLVSYNSGTSWSEVAKGTLVCEIRGTIWNPGPDEIFAYNQVTGIRVRLAAENHRNARLATTIPLLNHPLDVERFWWTNCQGDPTSQDYDGDGTADWATADGTEFDAAGALAATWNVSTNIRTQPDYAFAGVTAVHLRVRDTIADEEGAYFGLNAGADATSALALALHVARQADGTQTLVLYNSVSSAIELDLGIIQLNTGLGLLQTTGEVPLFQRSGLTLEMQDVWMVVDAPDNKVALFLNGTPAGTFALTRMSIASPAQTALVGGVTGAEYEDVSIYALR